VAVCAGLLGDLIRNIRCILTRLELLRRLNRKAIDGGFVNDDVAANVASVCAACDEVGFNAPFSISVMGLSN
jgi:hypothetical protein